MREFRFLVPLRRDASCAERPDTVHAPGAWAWLESSMLDVAGGYTRLPNVSGAWRAPSGETIQDASRCYALAIRDGDKARLVRLLSDVATRFGQQCVYLSGPDGVEFVAAPVAPAHVVA